MKIIENQTFDEERALYGSSQLLVRNCAFDGPADGESAFKECHQIDVEDCFFNLRYPFWHDHGLTIRHSELTENCRAALWYSDHLTFRDVYMKGKYSFQYITDSVFENCVFDTKDAFWHAKNVTVRNSTIKGEYLAWYSDGLTLINCKIIGTQPLCYCKNLKLLNCEMLETDLAFENSQVEATIATKVDSIKNPLSGRITVPDVGEIILDDPKVKGEIVIDGQKKN